MEEELEIDASKIFKELDTIKQMVKDGMCKCKEECHETKKDETKTEEECEEDCEDCEEDCHEDYEEDCDLECKDVKEAIVKCCPYSPKSSSKSKCPYLINMYDSYKSTDVYNMLGDFISEFLLYLLIFLCMYSIFKNMIKMLKDY